MNLPQWGRFSGFAVSDRHFRLTVGSAVRGGTVMKDLVLMMAQALVDKPDEVEVKEVEGDRTTVLELTVAKDDLGKVIGKQGKTARALRTILNATATKLKKRAVLEIIE
jgi:predicted RNA-binding protein YlqC (UPF0109 family)